MSLTSEAALTALSSVKHPDLHRSLVELNLVRDLKLDDAGKVSLTLVLTSPSSSLKERLVHEVTTALLEPLERFGVKLMSIGFLLEDPKAAVVWRGPMLHGALLQFVKDVRWGKLDYLILDLPPGTGDVALTLSQRIRSTGALIVTTPQEVALQDVYKSVSMCQKVGITVLGVVENESYFICDNCQKRHELFGKGGGQKVAEFADAPLLGQIPIDPSVREWGDAGTPVVQAAPGSPIAKAFVEVADRLADIIAVHNMSKLSPLTIDRSGGKGPLHLPITPRFFL